MGHQSVPPSQARMPLQDSWRLRFLDEMHRRVLKSERTTDALAGKRAPSTARVRAHEAAILQLQRTAGNAAVTELLQRDKAGSGSAPGKTLDIDFNAFIPAHLGKPFKSYPHQKGLKNQAAFDGAVDAVDGTWLPEPGSITRNSMWYFETDEREWGGGSHRVGFHGTINTAALGHMMGGSVVFTHDGDPSRRVSTTDTGYFTSTGETGRVDGPYAKTADKKHEEVVEDPAPGKTTVWTKGSAAYAFMPTIAPDIDYDLAWAFQRESDGTVTVNLRIIHDMFPFYELLINGSSEYTFTSADPGPTVGNLNSSTTKVLKLSL